MRKNKIKRSWIHILAMVLSMNLGKKSANYMPRYGKGILLAQESALNGRVGNGG